MSLSKVTQLIVHVIVVEAIKENGVKRILGTTWSMNVDYRACLNVIFAIEHLNTSALLKHIWDANTKLLLEKITN